ncbi:hypothetical protein GCM10022244_29650 [Streptomyces gulbargensis]|uniref:Uncharacterized protein n=1 Tax=Streptomyces gulbargensis TaxID=364901 RepID=A0ABP7MEF0_9ACTN
MLAQCLEDALAVFVLGVIGVGGIEEWPEAAVQRLEADERVKALQRVVVDEGERCPLVRKEYGQEVERGPPVLKPLVDPGPGVLGRAVTPCPQECALRLRELVDGLACGWREVPHDLAADQ